MYAVEFDTRANNGLIELPQHLSRLFSKHLHVVVMLKDDSPELPIKSTDDELEAGYQAMTDQVMAADKLRLKSKMGELSDLDMMGIEKAIQLHLSLCRN